MCALLSTLDKKILGFEYIKNLYPCDSDFGNVFNTCEKVAFGKNSLGIIASGIEKISYVCLNIHCMICLLEKLKRVI